MRSWTPVVSASDAFPRGLELWRGQEPVARLVERAHQLAAVCVRVVDADAAVQLVVVDVAPTAALRALQLPDHLAVTGTLTEPALRDAVRAREDAHRFAFSQTTLRFRLHSCRSFSSRPMCTGDCIAQIAFTYAVPGVNVVSASPCNVLKTDITIA